ncbi:MAG TPA: hypothetical protein VIF44_05445, partial [Candidatus Limnocylindrales bacterium]
LRPEERRPLFEEAAGVRRHERRRRQAEERLVEAEANLARVRDILGELRPQARRLAAQAEQQVARRDAAGELADGLLAAGRARWTTTSGEATRTHGQLAATRAAIGTTMRELATAEDAVAALARGLNERAEATRVARLAVEAARVSVTDVRLTIERLTEVLAGLERDDGRALEERDALEQRMAAAQRVLALPVPPPDLAAQSALAEIDGALAAATAELARAEASMRAEGERGASLRRAHQAREAELADLQRRAADAERRSSEAVAARETAAAAAAIAASEQEEAARALQAAHAIEMDAESAEVATRAEADSVDVRASAAAGRAAATVDHLVLLRERLGALDAMLESTDRGGLAPAARRRGGRRLAEGLEVDPDRRVAVEAALGDLLRAIIVGDMVVLQLRGERGHLVLDDADDADRSRRPAVAEGLLSASREVGGGRLSDSVRRDPAGHATRLLRSVVWVPRIEDALTLRDRLPVGWRLVTDAGEIVTADGVVQLGAPDPILERRTERERLATEIERATAETADDDAELLEATTRLTDARGARDAARAGLEAARGERRRLEEIARAAMRAAEATAREAAWETAQAERLEGEALRAASAIEGATRQAAAPDSRAAAPSADADAREDGGAAAAWRDRARDLRERREGIASALEAAERARRVVEDERRRAEIAVSMDDARLSAAEGLAPARAADLQRTRDALAAAHARLTIASEAEASAAAALQELEAREGDERQAMLSLEADVLRQRERLRRADEQARSAEVAEMEARLGLDNARENLLVELAALGLAGLSALVGDDLPSAPSDVADEETLAASLESALDVAIESWASAEGAPAVEAPSAARLGLLRRRYSELGASNPFAAEEYVEVRDRLAEMDAQQADLTSAIAATRELIAELSGRITEQFLATFAALEGAFGRRFEQLFGGGAASLVLTDPEELTQTGVEIMARPPGKKRQALAMLSGGERALTAVALLFAMLEVRPVPFCVLDEVDAALDEANVTRFAAALRELAETTQFIVITHNRGTIEAADALYGVTIGDDAVSRIISLRLAEATELVAAVGG